MTDMTAVVSIVSDRNRFCMILLFFCCNCLLLVVVTEYYKQKGGETTFELKDISFEARHNELIAIVGPTGSGKVHFQ